MIIINGTGRLGKDAELIEVKENMNTVTNQKEETEKELAEL